MSLATISDCLVGMFNCLASTCWLIDCALAQNVPTPLCQAPQTCHISMQENLSFRHATPRAPPSPSYPHAVYCQLTHEEAIQ